MFRTLKLIFAADSEWEKMSLKPPHPAVVFFVSILPLIVAMLAVEGWGLMNWGEMSEFGRRNVPAERILKYLLFYGASSIFVIFAGAALLKNVAPSFNLSSSFGTCFVLMAYGFAPILLMRALDAIPQINTWVCLAIGCMLAMRVLYHGVAHWLKPEQTKGLGVFMVATIYTVVLGGLVHFASVQVLKGRFLKNVELPAQASELKFRSNTPL